MPGSLHQFERNFTMGIERSVRLTAEGVERLKVELEEVRARRQDLYRTVQDANTNNEASDSGEYEEIKDDLVYAEARVRELEQILDNAEIIQRGSPDGIVALGSHITVKADDGEIEHWAIVSREEASIHDGDISIDSPVGQALVGTREGDKVTVVTPGGSVQYEVVAVK
jgi:transcription elongation factor GreA